MFDFMRWLRANYTLPQLERTDRTGYEMELSTIENSLPPDF